MSRVFEHPLVHEQASYQGCWFNEMDSILRRHYPPLEAPSQMAVEWCSGELRRLWVELGKPRVAPMSWDALIASKRGNTKKRFLWQLKRCQQEEVSLKDGRAGAFVKFEKMDVEKVGVKAPRLIQYFSPRVTMELSRFLTPLEHLLWGVRPKFNGGLRVFAKGRSPMQRASDLKRMDEFSGKYYCIDHSNFDSCVHVKLLKMSHKFYERFGACKRTKRLFSMMRRLKLRSSTGIKIKGTPRRCSGHPDTALGNSAINLAVLRWALRGYEARFYLDGDDSVVKVNSSVDLSQIIVKRCKELGFVTKVRVASSLEDVDFCQGHVIEVANRVTLMREPIRAFSRMAYTCARPHKWFDYVATVGLGEKHASSGCPILYEVADQMYQQGKASVDVNWLEFRQLVALKDPTIQPDWKAIGSSIYQFKLINASLGPVLFYEQPIFERNGAKLWSAREEAFRKRA